MLVFGVFMMKVDVYLTDGGQRVYVPHGNNANISGIQPLYPPNTEQINDTDLENEIKKAGFATRPPRITNSQLIDNQEVINDMFGE